MAKRKGNAKYNKVKFNLFERDGQILISLQMTLSETERSGVHRKEILEYYVAQDHKNIQAIINTLLETAKDFVFVDGNLESTYRKNDVFVIQDYEHIKYHPDLQRFVRKFHKKINHAKKKGGIKNLHVSENRRKFLLVKNIVGVAAIVGGITFAASSEYGREIMNASGLFEQENGNDLNQQKKMNESITRPDILVEAGLEQLHNVEAELIARSLNVSLAPEISEEDLISIIEPIGNQEELEVSIESKNSAIELASISPEINVQSENQPGELMAQSVITEEKIDINQMIMPSSRQASMNEIPIIMNETGSGINYLETYQLTPTQVDIIKAVVQHESGHVDQNEVYAVMSAVINRSDSGKWRGGKNPYDIIVASGQFQSYYEDYYKKYTDGKYAEYTDQIVDAMLAGELAPFHEFESFGSGPNATGVQFTRNGNKFH